MNLLLLAKQGNHGGIAPITRELRTYVTWNSGDESPAASQAGQPRGDCPYLKI
jgi:hypothetical protein